MRVRPEKKAANHNDFYYFQQLFLTLTLFMPRIFTNNANNTLAANHSTLVTHFLD